MPMWHCVILIFVRLHACNYELSLNTKYNRCVSATVITNHVTLTISSKGGDFEFYDFQISNYKSGEAGAQQDSCHFNQPLLIQPKHLDLKQDSSHLLNLQGHLVHRYSKVMQCSSWKAALTEFWLLPQLCPIHHHLSSTLTTDFRSISVGIFFKKKTKTKKHPDTVCTTLDVVHFSIPVN